MRDRPPLARLGRRLFEALAGRRLPRSSGRLELEGLRAPVRIRRDGFGIPHVEAESTGDAWLAMGFCQGQDRAFQLTLLRRLCHGRLAELAGRRLLPLDRLMRRIGLVRATRAQLPLVAPDVRARLAAFATGVNAAFASERTPHELWLLRRGPDPWDEADVLAIPKLAAFLLGVNWTTKLARQLVLERDGPAALGDLEPVYAAHHPVNVPAGQPAGPVLRRVAEAAALGRELVGSGAASNAWCIGAGRTRGGRPIVSADPHVNPALPAMVYLAHLRTPGWELAGAGFTGGPGLPFGHNGHVAWGVTSGITDVADLYLEEPEDLARAEAWEEEIAVRGGRPVVERILETPRGPVIGPAMHGETAVSLRAAWLAPRPVRGFLDAEAVRSFEALRGHFAEWPCAPLNLVGADAEGGGWQLVGDVPLRRAPTPLPVSPRDPAGEWLGFVPFEEMPGGTTGRDGVLGSANHLPRRDGPWLGEDWSPGWRAHRIYEALGARDDWDLEASAALQLDTRSHAFLDLRKALLAAEPVDADARTALTLLGGWDGDARTDSPAAAVFEVFATCLTRRLVRLRAPRSFRWAVGLGLNDRLPFHGWAARMWMRMAELVVEQPAGWFESWPRALGEALSEAVALLRARRGRDPAGWAWGHARPVVFEHPLGALPGLAGLLNRGPYPWPGDTATLHMGTAHPTDPLASPIMLPTFRLNAEVGRWDAVRVSLAGGQSGNPCSRHYDDLLARFVRGESVPLPWSEAAVAAATRSTLALWPAGGEGGRGRC